MQTYVEVALERPVSPQLDHDILIEAEADKVERLLDRTGHREEGLMLFVCEKKKKSKIIQK